MSDKLGTGALAMAVPYGARVSSGHLPGVLADLAPVLDQYGYLAVAGFITAEDFGVPAPGETILIAAAVYAGAGRLNIWLVVVLGIVGAVVGDNIGYAIGAYGGRRLVTKWGKYVLITDERLDKAERFFERHGGKVVVVARFIEGLRQVNGIVAGISSMTWRSFLVFNLIGATIWVVTWASIGYLAGNHITAIYQQVTRAGLYVAILIGLVIVALIVRAVLRRRRRAGARAGGNG
jgi:membrane protein DedA with SNARE-associated domain